MNNRFSELFIRRPVATTLLTIGIAFAGLLAFGQLPVSPLPQIDFATISVNATMPGGDPTDMAASVAAPLEKFNCKVAPDRTQRSELAGIAPAAPTIILPAFTYVPPV